MKPTFQKFVLISILLVFFAGSSVNPLSNLCFKEGGYLQVEPHPLCNSKDQCGPCYDIPLLINAFPLRILPFQSPEPQFYPLSSSLFTIHHSQYHVPQVFTHPSLPPVNSNLASLRSVILLI